MPASKVTGARWVGVRVTGCSRQRLENAFAGLRRRRQVGRNAPGNAMRHVPVCGAVQGMSGTAMLFWRCLQLLDSLATGKSYDAKMPLFSVFVYLQVFLEIDRARRTTSSTKQRSLFTVGSRDHLIGSSRRRLPSLSYPLATGTFLSSTR